MTRKLISVSNTEICFCFLCASYQGSITMILDTETHFCVRHRKMFPFPIPCSYATLFLSASYQWSINMVLDTERCFCVRHRNMFLCPFFVSMEHYSFVPHTNCRNFIGIRHGNLFLCQFFFLVPKKMSLIHNCCCKTQLQSVSISLSLAIIIFLFNWINHNIPDMRTNVVTIQYQRCT